MLYAPAIPADDPGVDRQGQTQMHSKPISLQLHWIVLLACAALVVALTTLPASVGLIRALHGVTLIHGHPNANDAIGHAALYGTLTAVIYWALRPQLGFTARLLDRADRGDADRRNDRVHSAVFAGTHDDALGLAGELARRDDGRHADRVSAVGGGGEIGATRIVRGSKPPTSNPSRLKSAGKQPASAGLKV